MYCVRYLELTHCRSPCKVSNRHIATVTPRAVELSYLKYTEINLTCIAYISMQRVEKQHSIIQQAGDAHLGERLSVTAYRSSWDFVLARFASCRFWTPESKVLLWKNTSSGTRPACCSKGGCSSQALPCPLLSRSHDGCITDARGQAGFVSFSCTALTRIVSTALLI
jgi:hypothetical protein